MGVGPDGHRGACWLLSKVLTGIRLTVRLATPSLQGLVHLQKSRWATRSYPLLGCRLVWGFPKSVMVNRPRAKLKGGTCIGTFLGWAGPRGGQQDPVSHPCSSLKSSLPAPQPAVLGPQSRHSPHYINRGVMDQRGTGARQGHTVSLGQDCVFLVSCLGSQVREECCCPCPYQGASKPDFCTVGLRVEAPPHRPGGGREARRIGLLEQELETGAQ